jgi:hypothetical protein
LRRKHKDAVTDVPGVPAVHSRLKPDPVQPAIGE